VFGRGGGGRIALLLLLRSLSLLADEALVDMRDNSASGNGRLDERVQLLVTTDGELQVARRDTLHLEILGRVAGQLENLSGEVLEDGGAVHGGGGADTSVRGGPVLQVTVDPAHGELKSGASRPRHGLGLGFARVLSCLASGHFWFGDVRVRREDELFQIQDRTN